jgi:hypothetical protein
MEEFKQRLFPQPDLGNWNKWRDECMVIKMSRNVEEWIFE